MTKGIILQTRNLTKRFGGIVAVNNVDFSVEKGVIKGLIGPNGSGKTTLINCITGVYKPDRGRVVFDGEDITGLLPHDIAKRGVARTWQIVRPFRKLTALDAVTTAALNWAKSIDEARDYAMSVLELVGFTRETMMKRGNELTLMQHKLVDLARALALKPKILFIDEIAAGLRPPEIEYLTSTLKKLRDEASLTLVVVEHLMTFIMKISDTLSVMHEGRLIAEGPPEEVARNPKVVEVYLGMRV